MRTTIAIFLTIVMTFVFPVVTEQSWLGVVLGVCITICFLQDMKEIKGK